MSFYDFKRSAQKCAKHARQREENAKRESIRARQNKARADKLRADREAAKDTWLDIPAEIQVTDEHIDRVEHYRGLNGMYYEYYMRLFEETNLASIQRVAERVAACHQYFWGDHYRFQRVFDVKKVQLCKDKFCVNCQHLKQASRMAKFTPIFEELRKTYDLYHLVFTVKNVPGFQLKYTLDLMYSAFKNITRYLSGDSKITGVNFKQYGYVGAVRCLEIVANPMDYHPHLHCAVLLKKDLHLNKYIINNFSYDHGILVNKFSELEIIIQKIFYLLMHGEKVQLDKIDKLKLGYSCVIDLVESEDGWHEVFKYVTKLTKDDVPFLTYDQFKTLYYALFHRRVMQGYGVFYNIADDDEIDDEEVDKLYNKICAQLRLVEDPDSDVSKDIQTLQQDLHNKNLTVISKRNVRKYYSMIKDSSGDPGI